MFIIFTKTNRHRQNTQHDTEKSVERHTFAHRDKGDSGRLSV